MVRGQSGESKFMSKLSEFYHRVIEPVCGWGLLLSAFILLLFALASMTIVVYMFSGPFGVAGAALFLAMIFVGMNYWERR